MSADLLRPHDHAEAVALFRAEVIGSLVRREVSRGELTAEIAKLTEVRYRPPGRRATKCYGASTLERWYYAYRRGGLAAPFPSAPLRTVRASFPAYGSSLHERPSRDAALST